jgi:uncharacterized 2Fe-2S/4Fe-4S cluster protein (DUF4445 family)
MSGTIKVTFEPEGKAAYVLAGSLVLEAAARAGIIIDTPCGGRATCGKCRIVARGGCSEPTETERRMFTAKELAAGLRLACQAKVLADTSVTVPDASRFFEQKILTTGVGGTSHVCPAVIKRAVRVPEPTLEDQRADTDRVLAALGDGDTPSSLPRAFHNSPREGTSPGYPPAGLEPAGGARAPRPLEGRGMPRPYLGVSEYKLDLAAARQLPAAMRAVPHHLTVVLFDHEIIAFEAGDTTSRCFGAAFDIGTTTVVGSLLDLTTGREIAVGARTNPQVAFGDDVVARITHATAGGLADLQTKIIECLNDILEELTGKAGIPREAIYEVTTVGNTTMNHLLLGLDPQNVALVPFPAVIRQAVHLPAADLGIRIHPRGMLYTMPNIAGFVGGDTVGVILAADMLHREKITLAVDIGTNGEMVLGNRERLVSCSTAAGPAFEGARIRYGMRAADGAIEQIRFSDDVEISVIGNAPARGLCGTALIDAVAELLRAGIVEPTGRMLGPDKAPASVPDALRRRILPVEQASGLLASGTLAPHGGPSFILAHAAETSLGEPVVLTQRDIRQVQLAKGAIRAGIEVLKTELGVDDGGIDAVLLAGAFGNFIRRSNALRIGLLPPVEHQRIHFIGNGAVVGAKMVLACTDYRDEAELASLRTEYLELGSRMDFQSQFASAMMFPEEDA